MWGSFIIVLDRAKYKVKELKISPGKKCTRVIEDSFKRQWTIIDGLAKVILDDNIVTLKRNETISIPSTKKIVLENFKIKN